MTKVKVTVKIPPEWSKDFTRDFKTFLKEYLEAAGYPTKGLKVRKVATK